MDYSVTTITAPPWRRRWSKSSVKTRHASTQWSLPISRLSRHGTLLALLLLVVLLSGCGTTVVREKCPSIPAPPANLMIKPLNYDLIPPSILPSSNAKPVLKTQ